MYEKLPHVNMKISFVFYSFIYVGLNVLVSVFNLYTNLYKNEKKLTNSFKLINRHEQNTNETSYLDVEEFHEPPAVSLYIFYL